MGARLTPLAALLAVVVTAAPAARGEGRPEYGGDVVGSLLGEPSTLDPVHARTHAEVTLVSLIFDTLYRFDDKGRVRPHLASALPRISADRLTAHIPLVSGVTFHDGGPLSAADVAASLQRLAGDARAGWLLAPVRGVRAGEGEVIIDLRRDTPELAQLLAAPQTSITPRGAAPAGDRAIGTGPFALRVIDRRARRVVLGAFDGHFAGRPYLDTVELDWFQDPDEEARRYERGLTHMSLRGAVAFSGHQPKFATDEVEGPATLLVFVGFGRAHKPVENSRDFRHALSLSVARTGFRGVGTGERVVPAVYPDAVDIGGEATDRADRSERPAEARAALARAARRVPQLAGAASKLDLEVLIDKSRPDDREVAEKVVAALYRLGVRSHIVALATPAFAAHTQRGACDLYIGQLATPVPVPALATAAAFAVGGDDWTRRMLTKARLRPDGARVWFDQRLPILPLFHRAVRVHFRHDLRGVGFDGTTRLGLADVFARGAATLSAGTR